MKKTQVLSVIALAFALGVVVPVASVSAVDSSIMPLAGGTGIVTPATASKAEAEQAVAAIENNAEYKKYLAAYDAVENAGSTEPSAATIIEKVNAIEADTLKNDATIAEAEAAALGLEDYSKYVTLNDAMNDSRTSVTDDAKKEALVEAIQAFVPGYTPADDADYAGVQADLNGGVTELGDLKTALGKYVAVIDAVKAQEDIAEQIKAMADALTGLGKSSVEVNAIVNGATPVDGLKTAINNFPNYTKYEALIEAVADEKAKITPADSAANLDVIDALKAAWNTATDTDLVIGGGTVVDPTDPEDPTNPDDSDPSIVPADPTVDGNGSGSTGVDAGASFGAPKTGTIAKSEGSASTSVAIMAAISTVVAGLGAAIVAIRNFKRNKNA